MFNKNKLKILNIFLFVLCIFIGTSINSQAYSRLLLGEPQSGWDRYYFDEESSNFIEYIGNWELGQVSDTNVYGAVMRGRRLKENWSYSILEGVNESTKIRFAFKGTSLRVLATSDIQDAEYRIIINDDIVEDFYVENRESTDGKNRVVYEIENLEDKIHRVKIRPLDDDSKVDEDNPTYIFQMAGIDIKGELVSLDDVEEKEPTISFDTVGSDPEPGWIRDDLDESDLIRYTGNWKKGYHGLEIEGDMRTDSDGNRIQVDLDLNSEIKFAFEGTELRVLGENLTHHDALYRVIIDDVVDEKFIARKIGLGTRGFPIIFQKTGLEDKKHTVKIRPVNILERRHGYEYVVRAVETRNGLVSLDEDDPIYDYDIVGKLPDEGWTRDDLGKSKFIKYTGDWEKKYPGVHIKGSNWGNKIGFDLDSEIKFAFEGKEIRILGDSLKTGVSEYRIIIDDVVDETFIVDKINTMGEGYPVVFKKMDLEDRKHNVTIKPVKYISDIKYYNFKLNYVETKSGLEFFDINNQKKWIIDAQPKKEKIKIDEDVVVDLIIDNIKEVAAEDIRLEYDINKLEYLGCEEVEGTQLAADSQENNKIRAILVCKGEENVVNDKKILLKLRFRAKASGKALVNVVRVRVTDGIKSEELLNLSDFGFGRIIIEE
ncbi:cohesin domain-containing protein [Peptostreptococcaceae bacterium AGR-M142]